MCARKVTTWVLIWAVTAQGNGMGDIYNHHCSLETKVLMLIFFKKTYPLKGKVENDTDV